MIGDEPSRVHRHGCLRVCFRLTVAVLLAALTVAGPPSGLLPALSTTAVILAAMMRWPRRKVTLATAASVAMATSVLVDVVYPGDFRVTGFWLPFEMAGLCALTGRLVRRLPPRQDFGLGLLAVLTTLALPLRSILRNPILGGDASVSAVLATAFPVAIVVAIARYLRRTAERRQQAVLRARREQRLYLARVLHDFVAHELTGMVLEVQAARADAYEPDQYDAFLGRLEESGTRALDSLDRTLQALREAEELPDAQEQVQEPATRMYGLGDLPGLVERFSESGSVRTELRLDEDLVGILPREIDEAAYTVVLEALTNIRRHAAAADLVTVTVIRTDGPSFRVEIGDNGGRGTSSRRERSVGGTGLVGLTERITLLGGTLTAGPADDGWRIVGTLPAPAAKSVSGSLSNG